MALPILHVLNVALVVFLVATVVLWGRRVWQQHQRTRRLRYLCGTRETWTLYNDPDATDRKERLQRLQARGRW